MFGMNYVQNQYFYNVISYNVFQPDDEGLQDVEMTIVEGLYEKLILVYYDADEERRGEIKSILDHYDPDSTGAHPAVSYCTLCNLVMVLDCG